MFKYSFVTFCFVVFTSKQSFALKWCSSNPLESLLKCLLEEKYISSLGWSQLLDHRIECSSKQYCSLKPWELFDSKIRLVRSYAECMKNVAKLKKKLVYVPETLAMLAFEQRCRKDLADNLPPSFKSYYFQLLPELIDE